MDLVLGNFAMLHQAASSHPKWQRRWLRHSAGSVIRAMTCGPQVLQRVAKVEAAGCQERYSLSSLLRLDRDRWEEFCREMDMLVARGSNGATAPGEGATSSSLKVQRKRAAKTVPSSAAGSSKEL
jgi:hypothetical protein